MEAHLYMVKVYNANKADFFFRDPGEEQMRLYFPNGGIFAFRRKDLVDGFFTSGENIREAEEIINGSRKGAYLGTIGVEDDLAKKVISAGRKMNESIEDFYRVTKSLVEQIGDKKVIKGD